MSVELWTLVLQVTRFHVILYPRNARQSYAPDTINIIFIIKQWLSSKSKVHSVLLTFMLWTWVLRNTYWYDVILMYANLQTGPCIMKLFTMHKMRQTGGWNDKRTSGQNRAILLCPKQHRSSAHREQSYFVSNRYWKLKDFMYMVPCDRDLYTELPLTPYWTSRIH